MRASDLVQLRRAQRRRHHGKARSNSGSLPLLPIESETCTPTRRRANRFACSRNFFDPNGSSSRLRRYYPQAQDTGRDQGPHVGGSISRSRAVQFTAAQPEEVAPERPDHVHAIAVLPAAAA